MLDRDTKGHLALGLALVDCLAVAGMTLPQAQAFFLVAMDEGRSVSEYAERAAASNSNMTRRLLLTLGLGLIEFREPNVFLSPKGIALADRIAARYALGPSELDGVSGRTHKTGAGECPVLGLSGRGRYANPAELGQK